MCVVALVDPAKMVMRRDLERLFRSRRSHAWMMLALAKVKLCVQGVWMDVFGANERLC